MPPKRSSSSTPKKAAKPRTLAILPARYASTRLPGKPLLLIAGKPMIQRTYEQSKQAKLLDDVVVATDDDRILKVVESFGGKAVMTGDCVTGTDRCYQALQSLGGNYDVIINVQGDEPCVDPAHIDLLVQTLYDAPTDVKICALAAPIVTEAEVLSTAVTKVVMDSNNYALYFSRAMIPHNKAGKWNKDQKYFRNCGMYCFRKDFLKVFAQSPNSTLQNEEDLEQLKVLEMGEKMLMAVVSEAQGGIDLPEQLESLDKKLKTAE